MADDRADIVKALFQRDELARYLHADAIGGRLHVTFPQGSGEAAEVIEVRGVTITADDAAAGAGDFAIGSMSTVGDGYRVEFAYPREGIVGSATLNPSAGGYAVEEIRIIER